MCDETCVRGGEVRARMFVCAFLFMCSGVCEWVVQVFCTTARLGVRENECGGVL